MSLFFFFSRRVPEIVRGHQDDRKSGAISKLFKLLDDSHAAIDLLLKNDRCYAELLKEACHGMLCAFVMSMD